MCAKRVNQNIDKNTANTIAETSATPVCGKHAFPPLLPSNATVMMMGTFPPAADKRAMQFHYPNFQNDMWRVYGMISLMIRTTSVKVKKKPSMPIKSKHF